MRNSTTTTTSRSTKKKLCKTASIGVDLGDRFSHYCALDGDGTIIDEGRVATTADALERHFTRYAATTIAMETGTHSPWTSRLLERLGHTVLVANSRNLRLIYENKKKNDRVDARYLARLARVEPELLSPIRHRGERAQKDLAVLRARQSLIDTRTRLIQHIRGAVKSFGARIPTCSTPSFHKQALVHIPEPLRVALAPLLETIGHVTAQITAADKLIERMTQREYPAARRLSQICGVGPLTSLAYVLVLEDHRRFRHPRAVGAYLGLTPATSSSGATNPQLRITKHGDPFLRRLLVGSAQYILGPFGPDSNLRRHGLKIAERGGKNAKKRALVAVARKLALLLLRLWRTGEKYEPLHTPTRRHARGRVKPAPRARTAA